MATTIITKNGAGAPLASDLVAGELAVDLTNKRLYSENSGGTIIELGTNPAAAVTFNNDVTFTGAAYNVVWDSSDNALEFADNAKAVFGTGSDLQIYHDGSNSLIRDTGTGDLIIQGSNEIVLEDASGANYFRGVSGSYVRLYHNNLTKLETTSTGIDVTGTVTADGLTVDGVIKTESGTPTIQLSETDQTDLNTLLRSTGGDFQINKMLDDGSSSTRRFVIDQNTGDISFYNSTGVSQSLFWDASAESLSIGTTTAGRKLQVYGGTAGATDSRNFRIADSGGTTGNRYDFSLENTGALAINNGTSDIPLVKFHNNSDFSLGNASGTTKLFWDASASSLGIGTTSPSSVLTAVTSSNANNIQIRRDSTTTSDYAQLGFSVSTGTTADNNAEIRAIRTNSPNAGDTEIAFLNRGSGVGPTERMRIDSSGNLLVGTTDASPVTSNVDGIVLKNNGQVQFSYTGTGVAMNRKGSDGNIIDFRKDGATVGSIGTSSSSLYIGKPSGSGLMFQGGNTIPVTGSSAADATYDLGASGVRFKDLYLSGTGYIGTSVGIGTTSPASQVHLISANPEIRLQSSGASTTGEYSILSRDVSDVAHKTNIKNDASSLTFGTGGNSGNSYVPVERMRIDASGTLLVGQTTGTIWNQSSVTGVTAAGSGSIQATTSAGTTLFLNRLSSDGQIIGFYKDGTTVGSIASVATGKIGFYGSGGTGAVIDASGNVSIGTTSVFSGARLSLNQSGGNPALACRTSNSSGTVAVVVFVDGDSTDCGSIDVNTTTNTTAYTTSSDQRLKDNIVDAPSASDDIDAIQVRSFDWKSSGYHQTYGLVAQELVDVAPEAVSQGKTEDDIWGVDYSKLVPMLIKEVQQLRARVAQLEGAN